MGKGLDGEVVEGDGEGRDTEKCNTSTEMVIRK